MLRSALKDVPLKIDPDLKLELSEKEEKIKQLEIQLRQNEETQRSQEQTPVIDIGLALKRSAYHYDQEEYKEALAIVETILEVDSENVIALNNKGTILVKLDRYEEAIASFDKEIHCKPKDIHLAWFNRGNSLDELDRYEEAIKSYDEAIHCKPDYHLAWFNRGLSLYQLGKHEESKESYKKALELDPENDFYQIIVKSFE